MRQSGSNKINEQAEHLKTYLLKASNYSEKSSDVVRRKFSHFISDFKTKWFACNRTTTRFLDKNEEWLNTMLSFPKFSPSSNTKKIGRPSLEFMECSERTKRQKTEKLRSNTDIHELCYATQMSLRSSGNTDAAKLVKEITFSSPKRATRYRKAFKMSQSPIIQLSGESALSMIVDAKLTRHQYNIIRSKDKKRFPSYKIVQAAKRRCYPQKSDIIVNSTFAEVKLQSLLNHTIQRLFDVQKEVLETLTPEQLCHLRLISKWGFDGSSGQSLYKQKFESANDNDASIFFTSLVPIQLVYENPNSKESIVIWQNPRPSSTRFCRPIKMEFVHESDQFTMKEKEYMEKQINELEITTVKVGNMDAFINHRLLFTMVDGKVCNAVTSTKYTLRCFICGATSMNFNKIGDMLEIEPDTSRLQFGLSILHGWIRFFECLLHISYKLPVKKWTVRDEEEKRIVKENKKRIQDLFKQNLGLIVDRPKPGFGNTNDGNTARRFFQNKKISAQITGVSEEIIERFYIIMQVVSSGYEINLKKFQDFALTTAKLFVEKYPWYNMPPTVHKFLIHGPEIIKNALVPIGQLSEEAQEARNKEIKKFREGYSRKSSRTKTNEDVFNLLLISSDPLISSLRELPRKKLTKFSLQALEMFQAPDLNLDQRGYEGDINVRHEIDNESSSTLYSDSSVSD